jgi:two-component system response regulator
MKGIQMVALKDHRMLSEVQLPVAGEPIVILLVDDDPDCRCFVRDAISESKITNRVFEVSNGVEAMHFLQKQGGFATVPRPGLIFLDLEMPGMDGLEVLEKIKSDRALQDIPVVMMTGVSDENAMKKAMLAGANSYTLKPANAEQFLRVVIASTSYWLTIHQYPERHMPGEFCRR